MDEAYSSVTTRSSGTLSLAPLDVQDIGRSACSALTLLSPAGTGLPTRHTTRQRDAPDAFPAHALSPPAGAARPGNRPRSDQTASTHRHGDESARRHGDTATRRQVDRSTCRDAGMLRVGATRARVVAGAVVTNRAPPATGAGRSARLHRAGSGARPGPARPGTTRVRGEVAQPHGAGQQVGLGLDPAGADLGAPVGLLGARRARGGHRPGRPRVRRAARRGSTAGTARAVTVAGWSTAAATAAKTSVSAARWRPSSSGARWRPAGTGTGTGTGEATTTRTSVPSGARRRPPRRDPAAVGAPWPAGAPSAASSSRISGRAVVAVAVVVTAVAGGATDRLRSAETAWAGGSSCVMRAPIRLGSAGTASCPGSRSAASSIHAVSSTPPTTTRTRI